MCYNKISPSFAVRILIQKVGDNLTRETLLLLKQKELNAIAQKADTLSEYQKIRQMVNQAFFEKQRLVTSRERREKSREIGLLQKKRKELETLLPLQESACEQLSAAFNDALLDYLGTTSAKVLERGDGTHLIDIYYGGISGLDDICHGHAILDQFGHIRYLRRPEQTRGSPEIDNLKRTNRHSKKVFGKPIIITHS